MSGWSPVEAVDAFGFLTYDGPVLCGERPAGDPGAIAVADPVDSWHDRPREWTDGTLDRLADTRFADVIPRVEPVLDARIDAIEGPVRPALARIDQSLENVLLDAGGPTALLDWEFTIAATPAYDLACVAWSLAGGQYLFAPGVPDRRRLVGEALLAGYRERGPGRVVDRFRANRACYELLSALRSMVHLEDWYRQFDLGGEIDGASAGLRDEVAALVGDPP